MKALKKDCTIYVEQILKSVNSCYADNTPSNTQLMELYSFIGKNICEQGEKAFVVYLAEIFAEQFPQLKGFSPRNLRRMRDFYAAYKCEPKLLKNAQTLSWTQNTVILECCENNEQRSFYLDLANENNLSKLALIKAIKEEAFEQALGQEAISETAPDCCPVVANLCDTEDSNTTAPTKNDCRAFVPSCKPFRQGIAVPQISKKAFRYICRIKIDLLYLKMIYDEKASLGTESTIEVFENKMQNTLSPPGVALRNKIPILLST